MSKGSGGTRLIQPASMALPDDIAFDSVLDDPQVRKVNELYGRNEIFRRFLVDAAADGFVITSISDNGSLVEVHRDVDKTKTDYNDLLKIARIRAGEDASIVQLTPVVHYKNQQYSRIYEDLIGTQYERKCPDIKIIRKNGRRLYEEYESYVRPQNDRKVRNMLTDGLRQSSRLIIDVRDGIKIEKVIKGIKGRIGNSNMETISIYDGANLQTIYTSKRGFLPPYKSWNK